MAAASLPHRLLAGRPAVPRPRPWCTEKIRAGGGFGVVYRSPARETGVTTFMPLIASNCLCNSDDGNVTWSGPQSMLQTMYWDKMKVSVKKSSPGGGSYNRASDVLIAELEKVRRLTFHPYLLWPLAVSPVHNMDDVLLVFECVHLGSLYDVLHGGGGVRRLQVQGPAVVSRGCLLLVMQQVCEALLFLHSRRWVHGCVSSHCVYLVAPCLGKLGNLEFLQRSEQAGGGGRRASSSSADVLYLPPDEEFLDYYYPWLAPEVLMGRRPTMLADLYQFVAVLWEVCTGEVPWGSADRAAVESALTQEHRGLCRRPEIPPSLDTLVDAALSLDPADREVSLGDVYQALAAVVKEGQSTVGLVVSRLQQASNAPSVRLTRTSRRTSATVAHRPAPQRGRVASTVVDDQSEATNEPVTLTDEAAMYRSPPPRRVRPSLLPRGSLNVALLGSKFDQVSLSSSIDPMDFTRDTPRAPAFSAWTAEKPSFETAASGLDRQVAVHQHQSAHGSVRHAVRLCKPASHSYGVSPFAQRSRLNATTSKHQQCTVTDSSGTDTARVIKLSGQQHQTWHAPRGDVVDRHHSSRGTSVCRTDAAILEDLGQGEQYYVKSVQTKPNHSYEVEVVTHTCPMIQHTLTLTSTNLLTGQTTVTEECTSAEAVQLQCNPNQISITSPNTSLNSMAGAASFTTAAPPAPKDYPACASCFDNKPAASVPSNSESSS
nr:inactive serine/threonine-protein kinase TEX14-like isoform X2 [Dermacentor andersoni]